VDKKQSAKRFFAVPVPLRQANFRPLGQRVRNKHREAEAENAASVATSAHSHLNVAGADRDEAGWQEWQSWKSSASTGQKNTDGVQWTPPAHSPIDLWPIDLQTDQALDLL
jgi:hypothetical protein